MIQNSLRPGSCDPAARACIGPRHPLRTDAKQASIEPRAPGGSGLNIAAPAIATPLEELAADSRHEIRLNTSVKFERIIVRTRHSTYEVIVLSGAVRGVGARRRVLRYIPSSDARGLNLRLHVGEGEHDLRGLPFRISRRRKVRRHFAGYLRLSRRLSAATGVAE